MKVGKWASTPPLKTVTTVTTVTLPSFSIRSSEILLLEMMCQVFFYKQHALKGQKLLAQGSALGIMSISKAPCKGKSFVCYPVF